MAHCKVGSGAETRGAGVESANTFPDFSFLLNAAISTMCLKHVEWTAAIVTGVNPRCMQCLQCLHSQLQLHNNSSVGNPSPTFKCNRADYRSTWRQIVKQSQPSNSSGCCASQLNQLDVTF